MVDCRNRRYVRLLHSYALENTGRMISNSMMILAMACRRARATVILPSVRHINIRVLDIEETAVAVTRLTPETVFLSTDGTPTSSVTMERARKLTVSFIQHEVANHYGISRLDLSASRRDKKMVLPRQVAMYLAKTMTLRGCGELGRLFQRDHTTILYGVSKIKRLIDIDAVFAAQITALKNQIEEKTK